MLAELISLLFLVAMFIFFVGRLQGMSSKDKVANYIQRCIEDPYINVYYDDDMNLRIDHLPQSSTGSAKKC